MPVSSPKGSVITNTSMGESFGAENLSQNLSSLNDIWQLIVWASRSLPTALLGV